MHIIVVKIEFFVAGFIMANSRTRVYRKLGDEIDYILERPDMYIGSIVEDNKEVLTNELKKVVKKRARYIPGLLKIFDEILVNAADNKMNNLGTDRIVIDINKKERWISIFNNGQGIPIEKCDNTEELIVSEVFQNMRFSTDGNDEEPKFTGGRNGIGAKLCNIFSKKFIVQTAWKGKTFTRTWKDNMKTVENPKIRENYLGDDFTRVIFWPDFEKFSDLGSPTIRMMCLRAYEIAACTSIKVCFNTVTIPTNNLKDYMRLFSKNQADIVYEKWDKWEIGLMPSTKGFQQVSIYKYV